MTRKGLYVACGVLLFTALCCLCTGCRQTAPGHEAVPVERLREGDLVFRLGSSIESRVVRATDARKTRYSHVGVLVQERGQWFVVHAVPGEHEGIGDSDRVKMEPLASFWEERRALHGAVMRYPCSDSCVQRVARHAIALYKRRTPFDNDYDCTDTTRLYCTELVQFLYRCENIDLSQGRITHSHFPFFPDSVIYPQDLIENKKLFSIFAY